MLDSNYNKLRLRALEAFETVCFMFPVDEMEIEDISDTTIWDIPAIVTFNGGRTGGMIIRTTPGLSQSIAMNMLGVEAIDPKQKKDALYEISNIISGNIAPMLNDSENVYLIDPPRDAIPEEVNGGKFASLSRISFSLYLDEGVADIIIYHV